MQEAVHAQSIPSLHPMYHFRWEEQENAYLLLYPEGIVKLNGPAGEIVKRCDGATSVKEVIRDLESVFEADVADDVLAFLEEAHAKGWIRFTT